MPTRREKRNSIKRKTMKKRQKSRRRRLSSQSTVKTIFDGSIFQKEFRNLFDKLSHPSKSNKQLVESNKPALVAIAAAFFYHFKPVNVRLLKSIHQDTKKGIITILDIIPEEKRNRIHIFDLYITLIVCGSAFKNKSLISLISIMANDKDITPDFIEQAIGMCLTGYLPKNLTGGIGFTKAQLFHIISLLIIVANTIWISLQWNHYTVSTSNLITGLQHGKIAELTTTASDMFKYVSELNTCRKHTDEYTLRPSSTIAAAGLLAGSKTEESLLRVAGIFSCFENPTIMSSVAEEAAFMAFPQEIDPDTEMEVEMDMEDGDAEVLKKTKKDVHQSRQVAQITSVSIKEMGTSLSQSIRFDISEEDIQIIGEPELNHVVIETERLIESLRPSSRMTYKQGYELLQSLVEEEDQIKLAKKLLSNEGFKKYMEEVELIETTKESLSNKIHIQHERTLYETGAILIGAAYNMFLASPTHTPLYDLIFNIKEKMLLYTRNVESKIVNYRNLITDVGSEIDRVNVQFNAILDRSNSIIRGIIMLISLIGGYIGSTQVIKDLNMMNQMKIKNEAESSNRIEILQIKDKSPSSLSR